MFIILVNNRDTLYAHNNNFKMFLALKFTCVCMCVCVGSSTRLNKIVDMSIPSTGLDTI